MSAQFQKDSQYFKFCSYGFLKNLRFFDPFIFLFFLDKGLTFFEIGLLISFREVMVYIMEIPAGIIADVLGRRKVMIFAFIAYIISFSIFFFANAFWMFMLSFIFYGFGDAFRQGTHKSMIIDYLRLKGWKDQKTAYYGHTRSWSQIGSAVSSLIAAVIVIFTGDYQSVFIFSTIPYFLNLIMMTTYPKELDGAIVRHNGNDLKENFRQVIRDLITTFKNPAVLKAVGNLSFYSGFYKATKDYLQPLLQTIAVSMPLFLMLQEKQRSAILIGLIFFFIHLVTAFASRSAGRFAKIFNNVAAPLNITLISGFLFGLIAGICYSYEWFIASAALFVIIYAVENLRKPIGISYLTDKIDPTVLSSSLSFQSLAETIIAAGIAPAIGWVADRYSIGWGLIAVSAFMLIPALLVRIKVKA
ncbi:MAG: MFS transporter [Bacteroidetes bacterium GWF2_43_63]|nr:MAG: MFS transporter [Bacteroidetes bacterium GWF2_43_63]HBG70537.1 MFS transporter [Bacteroidales bacterium]HCB61533.1 MFS transporter [Bacteroidales bacterium]